MIMGYYGIIVDNSWYTYRYTRPGEHTKIAMERSTMLLVGKSHFFDWAIFNSFLYVHQRVG